MWTFFSQPKCVKPTLKTYCSFLANSQKYSINFQQLEVEFYGHDPVEIRECLKSWLDLFKKLTDQSQFWLLLHNCCAEIGKQETLVENENWGSTRRHCQAI